MVLTRKADKETAKIAKVNELQATTFNIVSHQGPPRKVEAMLAEQKTKQVASRPFNFVTNLSHEDHNRAPLLFDEAYIINRAGKPKENRSAVGKNREFSIVNNNFYEDHDRKKMLEYEKFKSHTLEKYWATHDYDAIRGKFYDAEKEQQYHEQRQILAQVHGTAKTLKLAPSIQYSDGSCYDIVNHTVHDDGKITVSTAVADRSLHRIKRVEKETKYREEGEIKYNQDEQRRLARVSYKRWEGGIDRGYDFVKNSVTPADVPLPLPSRPASMWARLQTANFDATSSQGLNGAYTAGNTRGATAAGDMQTTGRIRNLSGAGPQFSAGRIHLETRDTFPDSPGTYQSADTAPTPAFDNQQIKLKPIAIANASNGIVTAWNGASRGNTALASPAPATSAKVPVDSRVSARREGIATAAPRSRLGPVPSLDLTRTEAPEPVSYVEPVHGAKGLSIPMVRTGGLSGFKE